MLAALIALVITAGALVLILLAVVATGIRREPPHAELSSRAPSLTAVLARRLAGVYVRRPDPPENVGAYLAGHTVSHSEDGEAR